MIYVLLITPILLGGLTFISFLKYFPNKWNYAIDRGYTFLKKPIFGKNKTIRGPIFMFFAVGLYGAMLDSLFPNVLSRPENPFIIFMLFALVGLCYSFGELPNSFIKRRYGIKPGKMAIGMKRLFFNFVDTFDGITTSGIAYHFLFDIPIDIIFVSIFIGGGIHLFTDFQMRRLELKK